MKINCEFDNVNEMQEFAAAIVGCFTLEDLDEGFAGMIADGNCISNAGQAEAPIEKPVQEEETVDDQPKPEVFEKDWYGYHGISDSYLKYKKGEEVPLMVRTGEVEEITKSEYNKGIKKQKEVEEKLDAEKKAAEEAAAKAEEDKPPFDEAPQYPVKTRAEVRKVLNDLKRVTDQDTMHELLKDYKGLFTNVPESDYGKVFVMAEQVLKEAQNA